MLTYTIPEGSDLPKYKYLYEQIRRDIISGVLKTGDRLPSKRSFAAHIGVSIMTVENAYRLLAEEGYIVSKERSGYYVPRLIPLNPEGYHYKDPQGSTYATTDQDPGEEREETAEPEMVEDTFSARYFPMSEYRRVMRSVLSGNDACLLAKSPAFGCDVLRRSLADYLHRYRGIHVSKDQIIIGSGSEYLYSLLVQFLGREGIYGLEDPSYEKIRQVYEINGAVCEMLPMDKTGISSEALSASRAKVLHVTPFHSFPTGITASAGKRFEYLNWAYERDGIIIEDDIDSEFAISSRPVETIFSMDKGSRVIYMNTFSRSMTPAVRAAYLVLPKAMTEEFRKKLSFHSCTVPTFNQYVLAEFISQGYYERHLNRLRRRLRAEEKKKSQGKIQ